MPSADEGPAAHATLTEGAELAEEQHRELVAQQGFVDLAYARLDELIAAAKAAVSGAAAEERSGALFQRFERDASEALGAARLASYQLGTLPLVFGRIDRQRGEVLHIGRLGVHDEVMDPLVVDWRAPAAEVFYRATVGDPMGVVRRRHIQGKSRRVIGIDDELLDATAPEVQEGALTLVGEGALLAALDRARTGRMADIVATIQAEQDAIVRAPLHDVLVVQGGPGTGKTAVALHRVAYLLYTHRLLLERTGVLVVGPNPVFLRYVEQVVPSLGESGMQLATCAQLLHGVSATGVDTPEAAAVKSDLRMVDVLAAAVRTRQRRLPAAVEVADGGTVLVLRRAASEQIVTRVRERVTTHHEGAALTRRLVVAHLWRLHVEALRRRDAHVPADDAALDEWLALAGDPDADGADPKPSASTLDAVEPDDAELGEAMRVRPIPPTDPDFRRTMLREPAVRRALARMWPPLTPEALVGDLLANPALIKAAATGLLDEAEQAAIHRDGPHGWTEADVALLDEAAVLLGPVPATRTTRRRTAHPGDELIVEGALSTEAMGNIEGGIDRQLRAALAKRLAEQAAEDSGLDGGNDPEPEPTGPHIVGHLVVDEAQDVSPMQWRMLARRASGSSLTLLGDLGQASRPWSASSWADVLGWLGRDRSTEVELGIGYRTPAEVMAVAAAVLAHVDPNLVAPRPVRSVGEDPRAIVAPAGRIVEVVTEVVAEEQKMAGDGRVAVVAPSRLIPVLAEALDHEVAVLDADGVKGLEFDAVIVVEPDLLNPDPTRNLRSLYVAVTRTTRRLAVVHSGELPAVLADLPWA